MAHVTRCKLVRMVMALLRYLKPKSSLPTAKDTGLGETSTNDGLPPGHQNRNKLDEVGFPLKKNLAA